MTNPLRITLQSAKARIHDEVVVLERALGPVEARTVALPLTAAFDALNKLLREEKLQPRICERCDMPLEYGQACPDCEPGEGKA